MYTKTGLVFGFSPKTILRWVYHNFFKKNIKILIPYSGCGPTTSRAYLTLRKEVDVILFQISALGIAIEAVLYSHTESNTPPENIRRLGGLIDQKSMEVYGLLEDFLSDTIIHETNYVST